MILWRDPSSPRVIQSRRAATELIVHGLALAVRRSTHALRDCGSTQSLLRTALSMEHSVGTNSARSRPATGSQRALSCSDTGARVAGAKRKSNGNRPSRPPRNVFQNEGTRRMTCKVFASAWQVLATEGDIRRATGGHWRLASK